jgi:hypothetical protein
MLKDLGIVDFAILVLYLPPVGFPAIAILMRYQAFDNP